MGTCTSTARRRQKQQQHNQTVLKNSIVLGIKPPPPLPPLPSTAFPNRQTQHRHPLFIDIDLLSPQLTKSIFHQTDTNSLIQLYSSNRNNNNNNSNTLNWMSSSSSVTHVPPRIPVPKSRLPVHHSSQQPTAIVSIRPKNVTSIVISSNQTDPQRSMSITNRPPPPTAMQTRFGFIPRPTAPGLQQVGASTFASRSRSISPTSTASAKSSSSLLVSQRLVKPPKVTPNRSIPPSSTTTNPPKSKALTSPRHRDSSASKLTLPVPTTAGHMRSRTPSRTSTTSPSSSVASPPPPPPSSSATKTDVNAIRDRYKTQKRMNFFIRRTPVSTANGSPVASSIKLPEPLITNKEKKTITK